MNVTATQMEALASSASITLETNRAWLGPTHPRLLMPPNSTCPCLKNPGLVARCLTIPNYPNTRADSMTTRYLLRTSLVKNRPTQWRSSLLYAKCLCSASPSLLKLQRCSLPPASTFRLCMVRERRRLHAINYRRLQDNLKVLMELLLFTTMPVSARHHPGAEPLATT